MSEIEIDAIQVSHFARWGTAGWVHLDNAWTLINRNQPDWLVQAELTKALAKSGMRFPRLAVNPT